METLEQARESALWSHDSPEWYTPAVFVEAARLVMGGIDLDPASHAEANQTVHAALYYDEAHNGLTKAWYGRVFLNPPGGQVKEFWRCLMTQRSSIAQCVWIGYSLEQLQTLQNAETTLTPLDFAMCIPRQRIAFVENAAKKAGRLDKIRVTNEGRRAMGAKLMASHNGPSHANYITYLGGGLEASRRFAEVFSQFGQVIAR